MLKWSKDGMLNYLVPDYLDVKDKITNTEENPKLSLVGLERILQEFKQWCECKAQSYLNKEIAEQINPLLTTIGELESISKPLLSAWSTIINADDVV